MNKTGITLAIAAMAGLGLTITGPAWWNVGFGHDFDNHPFFHHHAFNHGFDRDFGHGFSHGFGHFR